MGRKEGSFGMIALLLVMGAVMVLVASLWKQVGARAIDVSAPAAGAVPAGADPAVPIDRLPKLDDVRRSTNAHSSDVQDALAGID